MFVSQAQGPGWVKRLRERSVGPWESESKEGGTASKPLAGRKLEGDYSEDKQGFWLCYSTECFGASILGVRDSSLRKSSSNLTEGVISPQHLQEICRYPIPPRIKGP